PHANESWWAISTFFLFKPKKDEDGEGISDGRKLWTDISDWYEGQNNKASMARMARAKIAQTILHKNGDIGTYLTILEEQFQLLEDSNDSMSERHQVETICNNISDTRYSMECAIISADQCIDAEETKRKLHRLEISSKQKHAMQVRENVTEARGRGGGRTGRRGGGRGRGLYRGRGRARRFDEDNNDKKSSKIKWVKCERCDKPGHFSADCPSFNNGESTASAITQIDQSSDDDDNASETSRSRSSSRKRSRVNFVGIGKIVQVASSLSRESQISQKSEDQDTTKLISDSAANISVLGDNWYLIGKSRRTIDIVGFVEELERRDLPIVNALAKTYLPNGKPILLHVNEAAYLGQGDSLLSKIQVGSSNTC
ncbi:MAG: zinc finger CCHC domain-containing protein, partial [Gloeomargaritales cyanobacterium]